MDNRSLLLALAAFLCTACSSSGGEKTAVTETSSAASLQPKVVASSFNADSAFLCIEEQCAFGPRVPNSEAHGRCALFLTERLQSYGWEVQNQDFTALAYDGTSLKSTNIIASLAPEKSKRVILFAHWDSRPFCDNDVEGNWRKPVMGANDGASGVAVLLELARVASACPPRVGLDIVLLDSEDYGRPTFDNTSSRQDSWCLGSQYYGVHKHYTHKPIYGVLLDMVGGIAPHFAPDECSLHYAEHVQRKFWSRAQELGFSQWFRNEGGGSIMDDHYYINRLLGVPTIDIIDFSAGRGFPTTWHTVRDVPENIEKHTLEMVGTLLLSVLYEE